MPAVTADAEATRHDWTVPGVYPVAPGVHRVPLPLPTDGLRAVNVYVVVIETRAHLELLVAQGRLASTDADGVTVYQEAGPRS